MMEHVQLQKQLLSDMSSLIAQNDVAIDALDFSSDSLGVEIVAAIKEHKLTLTQVSTEESGAKEALDEVDAKLKD